MNEKSKKTGEVKFSIIIAQRRMNWEKVGDPNGELQIASEREKK